MHLFTAALSSAPECGANAAAVVEDQYACYSWDQLLLWKFGKRGTVRLLGEFIRPQWGGVTTQTLHCFCTGKFRCPGRGNYQED